MPDPAPAPDVRRRQNGWGRGAYYVDCRLCGRRLSAAGRAATQRLYWRHLRECLRARRAR